MVPLWRSLFLLCVWQTSWRLLSWRRLWCPPRWRIVSWLLWRGASTRSSSVVIPGCLQDGKRQELCQAHSKKWLLQSGTTKGSSAAERSGAPQMLHHQRLTSVAPPTAPPMQQRGSKKSWASNKLLLRCSLLTTALLGQHKPTSKLAPRHDPPAW